MRKTLNISVSEDMLEFIRQQTSEGRFSSVSEYLRSLVRRDQKGLAYRADVRAEPTRLKKANDYFREFRAAERERRKSVL